MQWGYRQDQKLAEIFGEERNGTIFNTGTEVIVESVKGDPFGGLEVALSGGYVLRVFPCTNANANMEWLLSRRAGRNLALQNGALSGSLAER
jgi:hypothetical protein